MFYTQDRTIKENLTKQINALCYRHVKIIYESS